MTDDPIELDERRGLAAQKATGSRRLLAEVEANERALRARRDELEAHLIAAPAVSWPEAAEKARYVIRLYAATLGVGDTQRHTLVAAVLADFARLEAEVTPRPASAVFGIVPCAVMPCDDAVPGHNAATPWAALVSTLDHSDLVEMLWLSHLQIDAWQQRWPVLQTVCDAQNRFRAHWLNWLGFECRGRVARFGAAGLPFDLYIRLGEAQHSPRRWQSP